MDRIFWLLPGEVAGRPGPDREPWDLGALYTGGIRAILSVNDGRLVHAADIRGRGIAYECIPLSENAPPRAGDRELCRAALPRAYGFVQAELLRARPVLVHCSSGKDRTGLFFCYFLMRRFGLAPAPAIAWIKALRPIALSADGWQEFAGEVLAAAP